MNFYDGWDIHRLLVGDEVRTRSFHDSVRATIRPGDVVLDVGAGSGILSLFAARAGASRVYALERAPGAARLARRLVDTNGLSEIIRIIESDAENAVLPEPVDVIVSEWLGAYGVDENMLYPVLLCRDRWLKPGGKLIPARVTAWLAPVSHPAALDAIRFRAHPYGLDLSPLTPYSPHQAVWLPHPLSPEALRAQPQPLWVTDCATMPAAQSRRPYAAELTFSLERGGVNGAAVWFTAEMPGAGELSNGPGRPATHWGQFLFPIACAADIPAGGRLEIGFHCVPADSYGSHHIWAARAPGCPLEVYDTRRAPHAGWAPPWRPYIANGAASPEGVHLVEPATV